MGNETGIILLSLAQPRLLPEFEGQLRAAGGGRELLVSTQTAEIETVLDHIEIGMGDVPVALLPKMPRLQWLQLWSAGADFLQRFPAAKKLPFQLTVTTGIHGQQIAEHLFALLLSWNRRLPAAWEAQQRHEWLFVPDNQLASLAGKSMLILGYGAIGAAVAKVAQAFGLNVTGLRRAALPGSTDSGVQIAAAAQLKDLLPAADYVVNILPATADTARCFGADKFAAMKRSALYINVGRGATTDEAALVEALRAQRIGGAILDVVESEPLPPDSPLWGMGNVLLTGHYAGCHPDYSRMAMVIALENLERYQRGAALKNLVDKERGY